jgi:hypothetical protein
MRRARTAFPPARPLPICLCGDGWAHDGKTMRLLRTWSRDVRDWTRRGRDGGRAGGGLISSNLINRGPSPLVSRVGREICAFVTSGKHTPTTHTNCTPHMCGGRSKDRGGRRRHGVRRGRPRSGEDGRWEEEEMILQAWKTWKGGCNGCEEGEGGRDCCDRAAFCNTKDPSMCAMVMRMALAGRDLLRLEWVPRVGGTCVRQGIRAASAWSSLCLLPSSTGVCRPRKPHEAWRGI